MCYHIYIYTYTYMNIGWGLWPAEYFFYPEFHFNHKHKLNQEPELKWTLNQNPKWTVLVCRNTKGTKYKYGNNVLQNQNLSENHLLMSGFFHLINYIFSIHLEKCPARQCVLKKRKRWILNKVVIPLSSQKPGFWKAGIKGNSGEAIGKQNEKTKRLHVPGPVLRWRI